MVEIAWAAVNLPILERIKTQILNPILGLFFTIALLVFIWGVAEMVLGSGIPDKRIQGSKHIMWGLIGMFIMISAFGIMNLVCRTITAC